MLRTPAHRDGLDAAAPFRRRSRRKIAEALHQKVWPLLAAGKIKPRDPPASSPAAQAANAHALMESKQHIGKIVLTW